MDAQLADSKMQAKLDALHDEIDNGNDKIFKLKKQKNALQQQLDSIGAQRKEFANDHRIARNELKEKVNRLAINQKQRPVAKTVTKPERFVSLFNFSYADKF